MRRSWIAARCRACEPRKMMPCFSKSSRSRSATPASSDSVAGARAGRSSFRSVSGVEAEPPPSTAMGAGGGSGTEMVSSRRRSSSISSSSASSSSSLRATPARRSGAGARRRSAWRVPRLVDGTELLHVAVPRGRAKGRRVTCRRRGAHVAARKRRRTRRVVSVSVRRLLHDAAARPSTVTTGLTESGATYSSETPPVAAHQLGDQSSSDLRQRGGVSGPPPAAEGRAALCTAFDRWLLVPTPQALAGESFLQLYQ